MYKEALLNLLKVLGNCGDYILVAVGDIRQSCYISFYDGGLMRVWDGMRS